jgi:hypothetical protein
MVLVQKIWHKKVIIIALKYKTKIFAPQPLLLLFRYSKHVYFLQLKPTIKIQAKFLKTFMEKRDFSQAFLEDWKFGNLNPAKMRNYSPALT